MYCEKCAVLFDEARCPVCGGFDVRDVRMDDPCFLTEKEQIWSGMLGDVLEQHGIPFYTKGELGAGVAQQIGPMLEIQRFYVPYRCLAQASELVDELFSPKRPPEDEPSSQTENFADKDVSSMIDVVAIGELLIDFACLSNDEAGYPTLAAQPGGAPGNFLAALQAYGCKTAMLGKVGDDAFGRLLVKTIESRGIDTRGVIVDPACFTTLAFVTLDETGNRSFSFARKPGADTRLNASELDLALLAEAKVFHFGTLSLTDEPARSATREAVAYAKRHGKLVNLDPNLRKPLWPSEDAARKQIEWALHQADVVKISDEEIDFLWGIGPEAGAQKLLDAYGVSLVYATLGPKGCHVANRNGSATVPSPSGIHVVDTTGAGDIFGGSAMSRLLATGKAPAELTVDEMASIARFACCAASLSTQKRGGIGSVAPLEDVLATVSRETR